MSELFITPVFTPPGDTGEALPGALMTFYETGASTVKRNTYSDLALTSANTNPVVADGDGRFSPIYGTGNYRVVLTDKDLNPIWGPHDDITLTSNTQQTISFADTAAALAADLTGFDILKTSSYLPGWGATLAGPEGGATYYKDTTTGTASTRYTNKNGFYDSQGQGFKLVLDRPNIDQFGASVNGTASANQTAIHAGMAALDANGGSNLFVPPKVYTTVDIDFQTYTRVTLQGEALNWNQGNPGTASAFTCTTGTWGIRIPVTAIDCGIRDLSVVSNGVRVATSPFTIVTTGVEYGILIEQGQTNIENVNVNGFEHGIVLANAGNANVFRNISIGDCTRTGFAATVATAAGYALHHPNLTVPGTLIETSVYFVDNMMVRECMHGMVLRSGAPTMNNVIWESNVFSGLWMWEGTNDVGCGGEFNYSYAENNWRGFTTGLTDWNATATETNNMMLDSTGVYITTVHNAGNTALSDFGYQITIGGETTGTQAGPQSIRFNKCIGALQSSQKSILAKQCWKIEFDRCGWTSGDSTNATRFTGAGGFMANVMHLFQWNGHTLNTDLGNRGCAYRMEASNAEADGGGLTMYQGGKFRNKNNIESTFTITMTGFGADPTSTARYTILDNIVTLHIEAMSATADNATRTLTGLPSAIQPTRIQNFVVTGTDNSTVAFGEVNVLTDGTINFYRDAPHASWTASGTGGISRCTITYTLS